MSSKERPSSGRGRGKGRGKGKLNVESGSRGRSGAKDDRRRALQRQKGARVDEELPSRKEIDREQDEALTAMIANDLQEIRKNAVAKRAYPRPADQSFSLVLGVGNELKKIPDIDAFWTRDAKQGVRIDFLPFALRDAGLTDKAFTHLCESIVSDCQKLLELGFPAFWSHVKFNRSLRGLLSSFVRFGRFVDRSSSPSFCEAAHLVFFIFHRMSRKSESDLYFVTDTFFVDTLEKIGLIEWPLIFDFCGLYRFRDPLSAREVVGSFARSLPFLSRSLADYCALTCSLLREVFSRFFADKGTQKNIQPVEDDSTSTQVDFVLDVFRVLYSFLCVFPEASHCFVKAGLLELLNDMATLVFPSILKDLVSDGSLSLVVEKLRRADRFLVGVVGICLDHVFFHARQRADVCVDCAEGAPGDRMEGLVLFLNYSLDCAEKRETKRFVVHLVTFCGLLEELRRIGAQDFSEDDAQIRFLRRRIALFLDVPLVDDPISPHRLLNLSREGAVAHVTNLFPQVDSQTVRKILNECDNEVEGAVNRILSMTEIVSDGDSLERRRQAPVSLSDISDLKEDVRERLRSVFSENRTRWEYDDDYDDAFDGVLDVQSDRGPQRYDSPIQSK